jgi:multidrug efflux pump subunit AcrA (membrane-fusion protein)
MRRLSLHGTLLALAGGLLFSACSSADGRPADQPVTEAAPIAVQAVAAHEAPVARFVRATGSLLAEEQADVAAEIAGRVVQTPVERGTALAPDGVLIRLSSTEADAQAREAEANAAQIEARLGIAPGASFEVERVPVVQTAAASFALAQTEFNRIKSLLDQRVVSQSEFEQRRTQMEATRQQYEAARNGAAQQSQALQAARARGSLARKAVADTVVRAPFAGLVAERLVSVGDYVTKGMKVAVVVRGNPLRVPLTVPEQFISVMSAGVPVTFQVDAYPGRSFTGTVRYVSPALEANQRALTVEAVVPNPKGELKPGLFATALIEQPTKTPAILVPASAVQTSGGTSRVFVVKDGRVEERIVTVGQSVGNDIEIASGLKTGESVATANVAQLADGVKVS